MAIESDATTVGLNDQLTFTAYASDGETGFDKDVAVQIVSGAKFVTVEDSTVKFTQRTNEKIVIKLVAGIASRTIEVTVSGETIAEEYLYSVADGVFFNQAGEAKTLAEVIGANEAVLTEGTDKDGNSIVSNGVITGVASSKDGLVENKFSLTINGSKYNVFVNVATLIIDEAEDFEFFTYTGAFDPTSITDAASSDAMKYQASKFIATEAGQLLWNGYYMLAKDIDASTATYGNAENPHILSGNTAIGAIGKTSVRLYTANVCGSTWGNTNYNIFNTHATGSRGLKGVFDGNGHTISNFTVANTDGIFGSINGGVVKNLAMINSGNLAATAIGATVDNCYFSTATTSSIIYSTDAASTVSNVLVENTGTALPYKGIFGVAEGDYTNVTTQTDAIIGTMATFNNVILVSSVPLNSAYYDMGQGWSFGAARYDAATVDGVETATTSNVAYPTVEGTANRTYTSTYTVKLATGAARYTSVAKLVESYNANNDLYSAFTSSVWSVVEGKLTFGA